MIKKLWQKLSHYSIKRQLFFVYIPIVLFSTIIIGSWLIFDSTRQLKQSYQNLAAVNAQRIKSTMTDTLITLTSTADYLSTNSELRKILSTNFTSSLEAGQTINPYNELNKLKTMQTPTSNIYIYTSNKTIPSSYTNFVQLNNNLENKSWFKKAMNQYSYFLYFEKDGTNALNLFKRIPLPLSNEIAVLRIEVDYNYLNNRIRNSAYSVEITLNDQKLFYSDQLNDVGKKASYSLSGDQANSFAKIKGQSLLIAKQTLISKNKTDKITIYSVDSSISRQIRNNLFRWSLLLIASVILTLLIVMAFAKFFTNRIQKLQQAVSYASIEDYKFFEQISGEDEVSQISIDFHKILLQIQSKEEQIYTSKLIEKELLNKQQQMEFNLLAGQINPHFLFNTLESIRMMAIKEKQPKIAEAIKLLAKSMRYNLSAHGIKVNTLSDQLDAIYVYVKIQKMRFGDRVNFVSIIDSSINPDKLLLLPLLIQPLIENSITHGLEKLTKSGNIRLSIQLEDKDLLIIVQDDGIGITEENLKKLKEKITLSSSEHTKHIGLQNINQRVKLFYGQKYGLKITSSKSIGTIIELRIKQEPPKNK